MCLYIFIRFMNAFSWKTFVCLVFSIFSEETLISKFNINIFLKHRAFIRHLVLLWKVRRKLGICYMRTQSHWRIWITWPILAFWLVTLTCLSTTHMLRSSTLLSCSLVGRKPISKMAPEILASYWPGVPPVCWESAKLMTSLREEQGILNEKGRGLKGGGIFPGVRKSGGIIYRKLEFFNAVTFLRNNLKYPKVGKFATTRGTWGKYWFGISEGGGGINCETWWTVCIQISFSTLLTSIYTEF